jgi:hypothetical protein
MPVTVLQAIYREGKEAVDFPIKTEVDWVQSDRNSRGSKEIVYIRPSKLLSFSLYIAKWIFREFGHLNSPKIDLPEN